MKPKNSYLDASRFMEITQDTINESKTKKVFVLKLIFYHIKLL